MKATPSSECGMIPCDRSCLTATAPDDDRSEKQLIRDEGEWLPQVSRISVSVRMELNSPTNQSQNQTMERRLHFGPYYYPGCSLGVEGPKAVPAEFSNLMSMA